MAEAQGGPVPADDQVTFPVPRDPPLGNLAGALGQQRHVLDLVRDGDAAAMWLAARAPGAQLAGLAAQQACEQPAVDRLGAQPARCPAVAGAGQEPRDLLRRPLAGELRPDHLTQIRVSRELRRPGPLAAAQGLVVRPPRLVTAAGLAVARDLPVDRLEALADGSGNLLHRPASRQAVRDGDAVIQVKKRGEIGPASGTSIPPASRNHSDPQSCRQATQAQPTAMQSR